MKITKNGRVLIETTNQVNGMLEGGGVCGGIESYPLEGVIKATGLTKGEILLADADDQAPAYPSGITIRDACEREMSGIAVRKGHTIQ